jgi:hypothetical protein
MVTASVAISGGRARGNALLREVPVRIAFAIIVSLATLVIGSPAGAQTVAATFGELRPLVRIDDTITVTDGEGATHKGRLVELSDSTLHLQKRDGPWIGFTEGGVNNIVVERADRLWNGMLIGFAIGAVPVVLYGAAASGPANEVGQVAVGYGSVGLLAGLLVDVLNKQQITVFVNQRRPRQRISLSLFQTRSGPGGGAAITIAFRQ